MTKTSTLGEAFQRAADGGIAAGGAEANGLLRVMPTALGPVATRGLRPLSGGRGLIGSAKVSGRARQSVSIRVVPQRFSAFVPEL